MVTLGTSLFLPPSMMPSSYQPVTTSSGSSAATASTDAPQLIESRAAKAMALQGGGAKRAVPYAIF